MIFKVSRTNIFDGSPVLTDIAFPTLILWMPSMGHGSSPTRVERLDTGTYRASEVFFVMPGEWELKFEASDAGQAVIPLRI